MKINISVFRYAAILGVSASLSALAAPAYAGSFTLNGTSGEWSNPNGGTAIEYKTSRKTGESKILWGDPASGYATAGKSGLGFTGIGKLDLEVGEVFNIGTLTHYNKTIWAGTAASAADLKLDLDFGFGAQLFDFTMSIDETRNDASYHLGGVCPYLTTTSNGCSDSITWSNSLSANIFMMGDEEYKLDLVGFSETMDVSTITKQFISQEGLSSNAHIFAQIVRVNTPVTQDVPEPATLLGIGVVGLAIARARRFNNSDEN